MTCRPLLAAAAALVLLAGCEEPAPPAPPVTPVRVEAVAEVDTAEAVSYSASIVAKTQVDVSFDVSGNVETLMQIDGADGAPRDVQAGDVVAEGDVLATVDPTPYRDDLQEAQAQLSSARADLAAAQANWERTQTLYAEQSATVTDYDSAQQQYQSALAQVSSAQAQVSTTQESLDHTSLVAPLAGTVLQKNVEVGTLVSPQTVGFTVADTGSVKAVFGVPDTVLASLALGDPISISTQSQPDRTFAGTITSIAPSADDQTRLFEVEVTLPNADGALRVGMIALLGLSSGAGLLVPTVPIDALVRPVDDPHGYAVLVVGGEAGAETASARTVEIGQVYGNRIAITSGLAPGDRVIVMGTNTVRDGQRVNVVP